MRWKWNPITRSLLSAGLVTASLGVPAGYAAGPCGPCGARPRGSRAAANPCAAKNPCAPRGPCGAKSPCGARDRVDPRLVTRPKNYQPYKTDRAALVKEGEALWNDTKLSTNGMACNTCHANLGGFRPSFAKPYPHAVAMAREKGGVKQVHADEMVQFCMVVPMAAKPLPWDSRQLAALTAYTLEVQKKFKPSPAPKSPCAAQRPCAPCAPKKMPTPTKTPCAAKNPCGAAHPCAPKR